MKFIFKYLYNSVILSFYLFMYSAECYKFLLVFPYPIRSLNLLGESYMKYLIDAGHQVTYISPFPVKNLPKAKYRHIIVNENVKILTDSRSNKVNGQSNSNQSFSIDYVIKNEINLNDIQYFQETALKLALSTFANEELMKLLKDETEAFDAVVVDWFQTELYAGIASLYNCPLVWTYSMSINWQVLQLVHEASNAAYTSDYLSSNVPPFSLKERIEEIWMQIKSHFIKRFIINPKEIYHYEDIFDPLFAKRNRLLPRYDEVIYNGSLLFVNEHIASGSIPATPLNVKFIGGFHVAISDERLSKDIQLVMDKATRGVIYFSMGSSWQSKDIPKTIKEKLLKMFGELKQIVIWKHEEDLLNLPGNVEIVKWAPQQSILAHPNCKIFITHGGISSLIEAVHYGIPTIGIPIYVDQFSNVNRAVVNGHAIKVGLTMNLAEDLRKAVEEMLQNPKYTKRIKELSSVYHDRLIPPGMEMVHWLQHVVRTRGATHLRSPALKVPFYQKLYLDLTTIVLSASLIIILAISFLVKQLSFLMKSSRYRVIIKNKEN